MPDIKQIVRIINADIPGNKQLVNALTSVSGIGYSFSAAICNSLNLDKKIKVGVLSPEQIKKIEQVIKEPEKFHFPSYLFNRRIDPETGKNLHLITSNLKLTQEFDIKNMKKIKSYKGVRHALGLPVRGQKTRSNFRKGKAIGVSKKKAKAGKVR